MAITRFNAKNGLSVGTGSINVIDNEGNATFVTSALIGVANSTDKLAVFGTTSLTGSVFPGTNAAYDLGSTSKFWSTVFANNLTGSLTRLSDGTSYLVAGAGISITTGSNGAVTITNDGTVGDITAVNAGTGLTGGGTSGAVTLNLSNTGSAGTYGSATQVPVFSTDAQGRVAAVTNTSIQIAQSQVNNLTTDLSNRALTSTTITAGNGLLGGGDLSANRTLSIDNTIVATVSGTTFTGVTRHNAGLSGSLTQLTNGTSYLIAGTNIEISTGSSGAVTISNTAPIFYQWNELSPAPRLNTTASVSIAGGLGASYAAQSAGSDVFFFVSGSIGAPTGVSVFGGDLMVSGTLETQTITSFSTAGTTTALTVNGSTRGTSTTGRGITIAGAAGGGGISGGAILIDAGDGSGASSAGGAVTINAGDSTTVSSAGAVTITAGTTTSTGGTAQAGSVTLSAGGLPAGGTGTAGSISLTTGNAANASSTPGNITLTSQRGKVILRQSTAAVTTGSDVFLFVTGTVGDSNKSVFAGDMIVSGSVRSFTGFSGSHTNLTDGSSYLIAGSNITITTGSNGSVTIASTAAGGGDSAAQYLVLATTSSLSAERAFVPSTGLSAVDGGANGNYTLSINDSIVATVSGTTFTGVTKHNSGLSGSLTRLTDGTSYLIAGSNVTITTGSNGSVTIASTAAGGGGTSYFDSTTAGSIYTTGSTAFKGGEVGIVSPTNKGTDVFFYVSGSSSSKSLFGGDVRISGSLVVGTGSVTITSNDVQFGSSATRIENNATDLKFFDVKSPSGKSLSDLVSGSGVLNTPQYLVLAANDVLTNERVFAAGTGISVTDGGAGNNYAVAINDSIVATVSGTTFTGATKHNAGLSGSLTKLTDGTSYLIAGTNVTITTGSNGSVTLSAPNLAPSTSAFVTIGNDSSLSAERALTAGTGLILTDGGANNTVSLAINDSVVATVSGTTFTGLVKVNGGLSGSLTGSNVTAGQVVVAGTGGVLSGSNNFWWDNTNNRVGIGTSVPTGTLHVLGGTAAASTNGTNVTIQAQGGGSGTTVGGNILLLPGTGNGALGSHGTVGLGTASPGAWGSSTGTQGYVLQIGVNGRTSLGDFSNDLQLSNNAIFPSGGTWQRIGAAAASNYYQFAGTHGWRVAASSTAGSSISWTTAMYIDNNGNVGINTTATSGNKLSVAGSTALTGSTGDSSAAALHIVNSSDGSILYARNDQYIGVGTSTLTSGRSITTASDIDVYGVRVGRGPGLQVSNTVVGNDAGFSITTGVNNFFGGYQAGYAMASGVQNVMLGYQAGLYQSGSYNTAIGAYALQGTNGVSNAISNTAVGTQAGLAITTGASNVLLGVNAGITITTGAQNTVVGATAGTASATDTNSIVIGYGATGLGSNTTVIGNSSTTLTYLAGNVGIGTTNPGARLQVSGSTSTTEPSLLVRHGVANGSSIPVINAQNSAGTSLLWLSGSGFVGVGTSSNIASNKMAVYGATAPDTFAGHILLSSDTASSGINNGGQLNFQMFDGSSLRGAGFIKSGKENGTASNFASYMSFGTRKNGDGFNTERMRIDSDGTVQIGYATAGLGNITRLFVSGSSNSLASVVTIQEGALSASAGATILSVFNRAGSEIFYVTGSGNVGINNGNLVIGTAGKGIDFSITTNSSGSVDSEVLDDYERGTWTPTISTTGGSITLNTTQTKGVYVKIGRMVWIGGHVRSSSVSTPTGTTVISGLPFTIDTWNAGQAAYMSFFGEWFSATGLASWGHAGASLFQGLNSIEMFRYSTAGAFSNATAANWDGSCEFSFTFCYNANV